VDQVGGRSGDGSGPMDASHYEPSRIQQVLRLKLLLRPSGARLELDAEEVTDIPKHAVFHDSGQFGFSMGDANRGFERDRSLDLQARACERNILQIRNTLLVSSAFILPADLHHVSTQQPGLIAPI